MNRSVNSSEQHALRGQPSEHKKVHIGFDQKVSFHGRMTNLSIYNPMIYVHGFGLGFLVHTSMNSSLLQVILWTEHEDESQKNVWDQNIDFPNIISSVVCGS